MLGLILINQNTSNAQDECPTDKIISSPSTTVCANSQGTVTIQNSESGILYTLVAIDGVTRIGEEGTGNGSDLSLQTYPLTDNRTEVKVKASMATPDPCTILLGGEISFILNPLPLPPTASSPQELCSSVPVTISSLSATTPTGCTIKWYVDATGGDPLNLSTALTNGSTYYGESLNTTTGCSSSSRTPVEVELLTPPIIIANANQTFCGGASVVNLSVTVYGPGMVNWFLTPTGGTALVFTAPLTNGITYYAESSQDGCVSSSRVPVTVTLQSRPTPTFISSETTPCVGSSGNIYTTETGKSNYVWTVSGGGTITSGGGNTDNSVTVTWNTAGNQQVSVNYYDGLCNAMTPTFLNVTVLAPPLGGTIASSTNVCTGTNSTLLTLSGYSGTILKWQSSSDNWNTVSDIANESSTYTATNLTVTTKYRAVLQNVSCSSYSDEATITVDEPAVGGTIAENATVCSGTNSTLLTLSGYTGTITKWQSDDGSGWADIANITETYTATDLTKTTTFRAEVTNGTCPPVYSSTATITIDEPAVGGTIADNTTVCSGTNSTLLTLSGYSGTIAKWQSDDGSGWTDIANTTETYTATNLTKTVTFRAMVTNGTCPPVYSSTATITIDQPAIGGTIADNATVCSGTNSTMLTLSGYTGTITKWQSDDGSGWTDIADTSERYTATNLTKTTTFRVELINGTCPPVYSSTVTITIDQPAVGGTIADNATVCSGTNSTILTLSGYTGTITKWQFDDGEGWTDIANTTEKYTATNLTKTTTFRAEVTNGICPPVYSSAVTITIYKPAVGGTIADNATVCSGTNSTLLTLSGYMGTITKWQFDDGAGWTDIANTTVTYTATNLTKTTTFRAEVTNGICPPVYSATVTINVEPQATGGIVAPNSSVCSGTNSTLLTLSGYTGTITKWQSDDGAGWTDIANTTETYTAINLTKTTTFRAEVTNGTCPPVYSATVTITVDQPAVGGTIADNATVCSGTNSTLLTLSGYTGIITKWQSDDGTGWTDIANTTETYTATNLIKTTTFRAEVTNGTCSSVYSSTVMVTVDPQPNGGSVAQDTSVCSGTNSTLLTLSGYTGTITKWQFDDGAGWTDIANTTETYTAINLTKTTTFRAEVKNGQCPPVYSTTATITVNPPSVGGIIEGSSTVCNCSNSTTLVLTNYTGSITGWQSSTDNWLTANDISNTSNSLTISNLIFSTKYRAMIKSGECSFSYSDTASITVNDCNTAPAITSDGSGSTATISVPENSLQITRVTATDTDVPLQTLTYTISGGTDQSLFKIDGATGVLSFVTAPDFENPGDSNGDNVYDVQVNVSDNCTVSLSDIQDIAVMVTDANDAPHANDDNFEIEENKKLNDNVLSNDTDEDGNNLSVDITPVQPPSHGTLSLSANGDFTYQSVIDYIGHDSFTYEVCDDGNPALCSVATVTINVIKDENCEVFVPNSFSPNGDGIHDYFKIRCLYNYENPILEVYNRWGNLVFKKDHYGNLDFWGSDVNAFWNGNSDQKGNIGSKQLTVGTYYYILKLNNKNVLTGFIFLNR